MAPGAGVDWEETLKVSSMAVIKDFSNKDDLSIFPPVNHENLHSSNSLQQSSSSSSEFSIFSSSDSELSSASDSDTQATPSVSDSQAPPFEGTHATPFEGTHATPFEGTHATPSLVDEPPTSINSLVRMPTGGFNNLFDACIGFIRSKVMRITFLFHGCTYGSVCETFRSFFPAVSIAAIVISQWLIKRVVRRRREADEVDRLMKIITEKDKKIIKLLHQIASMNELLMTGHKHKVSY